MSEYKRLLEQIENERIAMWRGLHGYADSSKHAFIQSKEANIAACQQELVKFVGDAEVVKEMVGEIIYCADTLAASEKWRYESLQQEQLEIENARALVAHPETFHTRLHKKPHDNAKEGDILLYKLKPYEQQIDPDRLFRGKILHIMKDKYNKRDYLVESLDHPNLLPSERKEIVYHAQVWGYETTKKPEQ